MLLCQLSSLLFRYGMSIQKKDIVNNHKRGGPYNTGHNCQARKWNWKMENVLNIKTTIFKFVALTFTIELT